MNRYEHIRNPQGPRTSALCGAMVTDEDMMAIPLVDEIVRCQECMKQDWNLVCAEAATWD